MTDNPQQTTEIVLDGKTYRVRPTFLLVSQVEQAMGQASRALGIKILNMSASLTEIATIVFILVRDAGGPRDVESVGEILMRDGYEDMNIPVGTLLLQAVRGTKAHEKEAAAKAAGAGPQTGG